MLHECIMAEEINSVIYTIEGINLYLIEVKLNRRNFIDIIYLFQIENYQLDSSYITMLIIMLSKVP